MFEHEHPLSLIELWSKIKHNEEETDEDDVDDDGYQLDYTKQDFRCQCDRCDKEINWFHRYYYKCDQCQYSIHKFCAELPKTLQHPFHVCPYRHHHLILHRMGYNWNCDVCRTSHKQHKLSYRCPECYFYIDLHCATRYLKTIIIHHPSHLHPLVCVAKEILCECDACGKKHEGIFYQCATCSFPLLHSDCAFLPKNLSIQQTTNDIHSHTHPLTLAYSYSPHDLLTSMYTQCRVCNHSFYKKFLWIYKCDRCRYYAHLDCATARQEPFMSILMSPEMDLFAVVKLDKPKQVTIGVRPLREGELPLLEATAGRLTVLPATVPEDTPPLVVTPVQSMAPEVVVAPTVVPEVEVAREEARSGSSDSIRILKPEEVLREEVAQNLKRKGGAGTSGTSKRRRHVIKDAESNAEETSTSGARLKADASPFLDDDAKDDEVSSPQNENKGEDTLAADGGEAQQLLDELAATTARQAELVAQLKGKRVGESRALAQKEEELEELRAQLAGVQAELGESRVYGEKMAQDKMSILADLLHARSCLEQMKARASWSVSFLEEKRSEHYARLQEFKENMEKTLVAYEEKLRALSIEYDEELYPHLMSVIAERRWLISHGLRLAALSTLESAEVVEAFGKVVHCAMARGRSQAMEELHEAKLLEKDLAEIPGYSSTAYDELVEAMAGLKVLELPHIGKLERDQDDPIAVLMAGLTLQRHLEKNAEEELDYYLKPDVSQLQVPVFARPRDILKPFALEKEVPLKEVLEQHAQRAAVKKGIKGKAVMCGIGAAHLPRSDGVAVSVPTVSMQDAIILSKLKEGSSAAPEESHDHRHSI